MIQQAYKPEYTAYHIDGTILAQGSNKLISNTLCIDHSKISAAVKRNGLIRYNGKESVMILPDGYTYTDFINEKYTMIGIQNGNEYKLLSAYHAQLILGGSIGMIREVINGRRKSNKYTLHRKDDLM